MRSSSTQARSLPGFTPPRDERAEETEEEREVVNEAREEEAGARAEAEAKKIGKNDEDIAN